VVTGYGTIDGRQVCVFSQDFTDLRRLARPGVRREDHQGHGLGDQDRLPIIGINEGAGARIQEGVVSLGLYGEIFRRNVHASGVIPQISMIMGNCAGGHVYSPAVTDFTVMVDQTSAMFITGPDVIKTVTGEDVTMEDLGGARTHNDQVGQRHYMASDEEDAIEYVRALLSYLPQNNLDEPPSSTTRRRTSSSPTSTRRSTRSSRTRPTSPTTCTTVIKHGARRRGVPGGPGAVRAQHHRRLRPSRGSLGGRRGQPADAVRGCLDIDASEKAARFVRTCDAFNIPVLTFVDVPGFLPGVDSGTHRHHPPWRQVDLRLRRSDRAAGHRSSPARPTAAPTT
jgi:propionyl-CoA carboxylase beta chain